MWCTSVSPSDSVERVIDERRHVPVRISEVNITIAVPSIRYGFPGFAGHASRQMEWRFTGECFACIIVQWRKVDSQSWGAVLFPGDYHSMTPCHSFTMRHTFDDDKDLVTH